MSLPTLAPSHDRLGALSLFALAFLLYASVSLAWSLSPVYGAVLLASLAISYILGGIIEDHRKVWMGFIGLVLFNLWLCLFGEVRNLNLTYGLFGNPNYLGCALALALAGALAYRLWWFLPVGALGLFYTQSRGALVAAGVAGVYFCGRKGWIVAGCVILVTAIAIRFSTDIHGEFRVNGVLARLGIWESVLAHMSFFGRGFGSFSEAYNSFPVRINMTEFRAAHSYNDYLEIMFDLGIGAALLWTLLALTFEQASAETRLICVTFFILALTYFPTYVPVVGQMFAFTLGKQGERNGKMAPAS